MMGNEATTIILVHGAWGDGSHWRYVIPKLHHEGYKVRSVQNPLTSIVDDIQKTSDLINMQEGPVILVGHSYGGAVISAAGNHEKVAALVYIAAFAPDEGESLMDLLARRKQPSGLFNIIPDRKGFQWISYEKFWESFAHDLDEDEALVMALAQKPTHGSIFAAKAGKPAWKSKPSWYQVSDNDRMIPPATQKEMAERIQAKKTIHLDASHASLVSHADEITALIKEAVAALS